MRCDHCLGENIIVFAGRTDVGDSTSYEKWCSRCMYHDAIGHRDKEKYASDIAALKDALGVVLAHHDFMETKPKGGGS